MEGGILRVSRCSIRTDNAPDVYLQPVIHAQTAYTRKARTAFPPSRMGSQPMQARSGAVDTPPFVVGAGFRAGFGEKVCQGNQATTGGTLVYSRTSVLRAFTREYESLREKNSPGIIAIII